MPKPPKPPPLTAEEKKKLKEEKKLAAQLALQEGLRQVKRDHLSRELKYGQKSRKVLEKKWIEMLMEIKLPELKTDLELLMNKTDLILDSKDSIIGVLLDELDQAEEQYSVNLRAHCSNMLKLYQLYMERLNDLKDEYDAEYKFLLNNKEKTDNEIKSMFFSKETYVKTMLHELCVQEKYTGTMERSMYMSRQRELEQKYNDDTNARRKKTEDYFESIWNCFMKTIENYYEELKEFEKDYDERFKRDCAIVKIIVYQSDEILNKHNVLRIAREQQANEREKVEKKLYELNKEKDFLHNIFIILKKIYLQDLNYDEKLLTNLVLFSNKQISRMEQTEYLGKQILRMYSLVRKLETKREKILAFPKSKPKKIKKLETHDPDDVENVWSHLNLLNNFWLKCAQANLGRNGVHNEYLQLLEENSYLKTTIKCCLHYSCNKKIPPLTPLHTKMLKPTATAHAVQFL